MGEDGSELISADDLATTDFQGCQAPVCQGVWTLNGGEDLVAHSELLGDDPFWLTSTDFMPRAAPSMVPVPVLRVSQVSIAGCHANRHHSILFDFDQFTRERAPAGSLDSLENPIMGQDQVAFANLRDCPRPSRRRSRRIGVEA